MSTDPSQPLWRQVIADPVHWLAFGFGTGLSPKAPGTFGSLPGIAFFWLLLPLGPWVSGGALVLAFFAGIAICGVSSRRLGVHDHGGIVWDEIVGMWLTLLLGGVTGVLGIALGFGLFRLFDIWKPWPIRDLDHRLHGGLGIMLDDVVAGLYAGAILLVIQTVTGIT